MKFEIHNNWIIFELFIAIQLKLRKKSYNHNVTFEGNILKTFHVLLSQTKPGWAIVLSAHPSFTPLNSRADVLQMLNSL